MKFVLSIKAEQDTGEPQQKKRASPQTTRTIQNAIKQK